MVIGNSLHYTGKNGEVLKKRLKHYKHVRTIASKKVYRCNRNKPNTWTPSFMASITKPTSTGALLFFIFFFCILSEWCLMRSEYSCIDFYKILLLSPIFFYIVSVIALQILFCRFFSVFHFIIISIGTGFRFECSSFYFIFKCVS